MSFPEPLSRAISTSVDLVDKINATSGGLLPLPSATVLGIQDVSSQPTRSWLGTVGHLLLVALKIVPGILYWLVTFCTITLPTFSFKLFSTSLTFTMNATTLYVQIKARKARLTQSRMLIMVACVSTISWLVRYRFLNMYARLPPEPQRKEPQIDLYPDTQDEDPKSGLSNYLDEFLSAIKVFGYLERPVFHELTRSMQTRKLIAGETFNLEDEKGFCLVVDGLVEIFVKTARESRQSDKGPRTYERYGSTDSSEEEEHRRTGHQRYQLLTEVKNGAPMSSLFSILSLFTEDVKLRFTNEEWDSGTPSTSGMYDHSHEQSFSGEANGGPMRPMSGLPYGETRPSRERRASSMASAAVEGDLPHIPSYSLDSGPELPRRRPKLRRAQTSSVHPDIVARATVDTTIAIIPTSAFRRLTRVYPKATSHIVQVILTRLQRVTLATGHSYLGLTSEVLRTEKHMNKYTTYELPNFLRGDALERLKTKFTRERERLGPEEGSKGIALHNSAAGRPRRSSASLRKEATLHALSSKDTSADKLQKSPSNENSGVTPSPGDLLTNIHMSRNGGYRTTTPRMGQGPGTDIFHHDIQSPLAQATRNPFPTVANPRMTVYRQVSQFLGVRFSSLKFHRGLRRPFFKNVLMYHKRPKHPLDFLMPDSLPYRDWQY